VQARLFDGLLKGGFHMVVVELMLMTVMVMKEHLTEYLSADEVEGLSSLLRTEQVMVIRPQSRR
jgi:hypothetical protein